MPGKREIWFRRTVLWGSRPIHWKGVVVILVGVTIGVGGGNLAMVLDQPILAAVLVVGAFVWTFALAERHMERR